MHIRIIYTLLLIDSLMHISGNMMRLVSMKSRKWIMALHNNYCFTSYMVYPFSKFSAIVGVALHYLGHVLFSTNPEDPINILKLRSLLRTNSARLSWLWTVGGLEKMANLWRYIHRFTWRCSNCNLEWVILFIVEVTTTNLIY